MSLLRCSCSFMTVDPIQSQVEMWRIARRKPSSESQYQAPRPRLWQVCLLDTFEGLHRFGADLLPQKYPSALVRTERSLHTEFRAHLLKFVKDVDVLKLQRAIKVC